MHALLLLPVGVVTFTVVVTLATTFALLATPVAAPWLPGDSRLGSLSLDTPLGAALAALAAGAVLAGVTALRRPRPRRRPRRPRPGAARLTPGRRPQPPASRSRSHALSSGPHHAASAASAFCRRMSSTVQPKASQTVT